MNNQERNTKIKLEINALLNAINVVNEAVQESIDNDNFIVAKSCSNVLLQMFQVLSIMIEKNVTKDEAKAIIEAQKVEPA